VVPFFLCHPVEWDVPHRQAQLQANRLTFETKNARPRPKSRDQEQDAIFGLEAKTISSMSHPWCLVTMLDWSKLVLCVGWQRLTVLWLSRLMLRLKAWMSSSTMRLCGPYGAVVSGHGRKELGALRCDSQLFTQSLSCFYNNRKLSLVIGLQYIDAVNWAPWSLIHPASSMHRATRWRHVCLSWADASTSSQLSYRYVIKGHLACM